jgi:hypothetical protein
MRTRRSVRNQDRLYRALGGKQEKPAPLPPKKNCWTCASFPPHGRKRGQCALKGEMVRGSSLCETFLARKP